MTVLFATALLLRTAAFPTGHGSCPPRPAPDSVQLAPGQSVTRIILACVQHNHTGIWLARGGKYEFRADGQWTDGGNTCGPDGYKSSDARWYSVWILYPAQLVRREGSAKWFELIGEVPYGSDHHIRIGRGSDSTWTATTSGELGAFANDVSLMYWNNSGSVTLTVTRVH